MLVLCGCIKHKTDKKIILLQYDSVIQKKNKNKCESKGDLEFKRKIGGSFENLLALYVKYNHGCYTKYLSKKMRKTKIIKRLL